MMFSLLWLIPRGSPSFALAWAVLNPVPEVAVPAPALLKVPVFTMASGKSFAVGTFPSLAF